jgi:hypothetical protein
MLRNLNLVAEMTMLSARRLMDVTCDVYGSHLRFNATAVIIWQPVLRDNKIDLER